MHTEGSETMMLRTTGKRNSDKIAALRSIQPQNALEGPMSEAIQIAFNALRPCSDRSDM